MTQALEGLRVIDMSHVIAGPLASFYLAQLGAEVIKIEPPAGGDVMRAAGAATGEGDTPAGFAALNAGKRSFAVDIRQPDGAALVRQLARSADVFIENFRPGVVARYGLDYDSIRRERENIIYCSISGFGQDGAWAGRGAYDHVVQALTGMMMMGGDREDAPPVKVGFPVIDVAVGLLGAMSVMAALHQRARDGRGRRIETAMTSAALALMYPAASAWLTEGRAPPRIGNRGFTGSPGADTWACRDGWLATAANTPEQFRRFTDLLGLSALCQDAALIDQEAFNAPGGGFVVARDAARLRARMNEALSDRSAYDMEQALNAASVPAARVRRLGEFIDEASSPDVGILSPWHYKQGDRELRTPGLGFRFFDQPDTAREGAPPLGADSLRVLEELGVDPTRAREILRAGVVRASD